MTPDYFPPPSTLPFLEENQSQDHLHSVTISQPSSSSLGTFFTQNQNQNQDHERDFQVRAQKPLQLLKNEMGVQVSAAGPSNRDSLAPATSLLLVEESNGCSQKPWIHKHEDHGQCESGPIRWMSSKMRMMRKMINSDQIIVDKLISSAHASQNEQRSLPDENSKGSSYSSSSNNMMRVCADCNTTKTPLWRSGPQGPKSLCNACGIRQRKARRAMAAAAATAATGEVMATETFSMIGSKVPKEKRSECTTQHKKRCKLAAPHTKKKLLFDDLTISLSKSLAFHQVFPQDEKEAAILLMAISYGLVNG